MFGELNVDGQPGGVALGGAASAWASWGCCCSLGIHLGV